MNCIGIITAMNSEFNAAQKAIAGIPAVNLKKQFSLKSYRLTLWEHDKFTVIVIKTGVGYDNAGQATDFLLRNYQINMIINPGIAGAINVSCSVGDLFLCNAVIYEKKPEEIIKTENEFYSVARNICDKTGIKFCEGKVITVIKPLFDSSKRSYIRETYHVDVVDMEMAAIVRQSGNCEIPLLSFKTISDMADDSLKIFNVIFTNDGKMNILPLLKLLFKNPSGLINLIKTTFQNFKTALTTLESFLKIFLKAMINNGS